MKSIYSVLSIVIFFIGCKSAKDSSMLKHKKQPSLEIAQTWYQKDFISDTIPGISLDKWYSSNKKRLKSKSIIVAVIDTQIDLKHEDLKEQIWTNASEIYR
ncbi:hypothetical protein D3C85_1250600 [compost metagenome]